MSHHVLVLGDDSRACLAVVRSLGRRGIRVLLATPNQPSIVPHSRYVAQTVPCPDFASSPDTWQPALIDLIQQHAVSLVIPCTDQTLIPLARHRQAIERHTRLAIPDDRAVETSYRKDKTLALAQQLGVPIPASQLITKLSDLADLRSDPRFALPLIVKPVSSMVWRAGVLHHLTVKKVTDWAELEAVITDSLTLSPVLIQAYLAGVGIGQEFLAHEGQILSEFQHERIHEPLGGGGSSYRRSIPLNPAMRAHSAALLADLGWTGVVMIEYRQNPVTGEFVLMEINGRWWGSLPLAVAAGSDFPFQLYNLIMHKQLDFNQDYVRGLYGRNPVRDLVWFESIWRTQPAAIWQIGRELARGLRNVLTGRERWDTLVRDDPGPGVIELRQFLVYRLRRRVTLLRWRCRTALPIWRNAQRRRFRRQVTTTPTILWVSGGNICRSAFAESYWQTKNAASDRIQLATSSAGYTSAENRPTPELVRQIGLEFGVDLSEHRSSSLTHDQINHAGAILCVDLDAYYHVLKRYPAAQHKLFLLPTLRAHPHEIEVPAMDELSSRALRRIFALITDCLDDLINLIDQGK